MLLLLGYKSTTASKETLYKLAQALGIPAEIRFTLSGMGNLNDAEAVVAFGKAALNSIPEDFKGKVLETHSPSKLKGLDSREKNRTWKKLQAFAKENLSSHGKTIKLEFDGQKITVGEGAEIEWRELDSLLTLASLLETKAGEDGAKNVRISIEEE